jgi:hypothetical protein
MNTDIFEDLIIDNGYSEELDGKRIEAQTSRIFKLICNGDWYTLRIISDAINAPEASVSAGLRSFRRPRNGGYVVERRRVPNGNGLHEYRLDISSGDLVLA